MKIMYATTNPGKFAEVKKLYAAYGINVYAPGEEGISIDIDEEGSTLEENALLKAEGYRSKVSSEYIVLGDDTGLEIDALNGEPGIYVRRWNGSHMTDQEIREYCLAKMKNVPVGARQAHFRTVIAIARGGGKKVTYEGKLDGEILVDPAPQTIPGFPFEPLFYIPEYHHTLGEIYAMTAQERSTYQTHRHRAVHATVPYLRQLIDRS